MWELLDLLNDCSFPFNAESSAGIQVQLFNPCNAWWPFYFPLLLQFSSSLSLFGLITSTWSCKWKMLPVSCSIHSHLVLHCWRQGALLFFSRLHRHWGFRARGRSAPSGHAASEKTSVTFQPEDSIPLTSACALSLCSLPCADTQARDAEAPTPCPTRESTLLESHCEGAAVPPEPRGHWVYIINLKLTLSWPSLAKCTNL